MTHVQATESSIKNLERQVGQLAEAVTTIAQHTSKSLPSQTEVNPQVRNVNAMHLRCGKSIGSGPKAEQEEEVESLQKSETRGRTP